MSHVLLPATAFLCATAAVAASVPAPDSPPVAQIIRQSLLVNSLDWQAQPGYAFSERDLKKRIDDQGQFHLQEAKTYDVSVIDGSPYSRLVAIENEPLGKAQAEAEQVKFKREMYRRQHESPAERQDRISKYLADRREAHMLMEQMTQAFIYTLVGKEQVAGVDCYVLDAAPNPSYRPPVEKARVLTGMKGRLWIDTAHYHWARVEAEVISPVEFGLFIAKVKPGTRFELEQAPVGDVWLPKFFAETVNATVLGFYGMRSKQEEHYSNYHQQMLRAENVSTVQ